ncbi:MAG TPA: glycosyltransferase family 4 protein [bacterium]|nr:glycosyltransferase family 4 protein [bacterium]
MIINVTSQNSPIAPQPGERVVEFAELLGFARRPWALPRLLWARRHERCVSVVDIAPHYVRPALVHLLNLLVRAGEHRIVDRNGHDEPVSWRAFFLHDLPRLLGDLAASLPLRRLMRRRLDALCAAPEQRVGPPPDDGRLHYYRTDLLFGLTAGGSVGHITGVASAFARQGFDVDLFACEDLVFLRDKPLRVRVFDPGSRFRNLPEIRLFHYGLDFTARLGTIVAAEGAPDMVYQRLSLNNFAGVELSREWNVPFILEYNGSEVWASRHWGGRMLRHAALSLRAEDACFRHAQLIVVVSEPLKEELISRGVDADKILVNPNGVDPDAYSPARFAPEELRVVREKFGWSADAPVAGFIGTFSAWHGVLVLAEAIVKLKRARPDLRFLLVGDGPLMAQVRRIVREGDAEDVCAFTGLVPQHEAPRLLAACDLYLSPHVPNVDGSRFFGSPTKLFEYMALGRAIAASDLEQIGRVLRDGETALLTEPGNVDALVAAVTRLVDDEPLRLRLGAAAREAALAEHTWEAHVRRIRQALAERCGRRQSQQ